METLSDARHDEVSWPQPPDPNPFPEFDLVDVPRLVMVAVDILVVVVATQFILGQLGLGNMLHNNTPTGGDMGAHVWGPLFLRDHLLPHWSLSGWTPDWYDGFPAYQFYMVLPSLLIVALNVGWHGWAIVLPLAAAIALLVTGLRSPRRTLRRRVLATAAVLVALFGIGLPYGVAFKLVTVIGLLSLPVCAYALGRLARLPFPTPALFALAMLPFLFNLEPKLNGTGNIIGGNFTSTMAGEFAFSISLSFAVLFAGVVVAGFRTGRYRWLGALLLALTALCHVIPAIWAIGAALLALVVWPGKRRVWWLATVLPVGALVSAFWTFPFYARSGLVNDMGWEKLPAGSTNFNLWELITNRAPSSDLQGSLNQVRDQFLHRYLAPSSLYWLIALAVVGVVVSVVLSNRAGLWLALVTASTAVAFVAAPEARLWNARILPFYYLGLALLAALGVAELGRAIAVLAAPDPERPLIGVTAGVTVGALALVVVAVGIPLDALPGETRTAAGLDWYGFTAASNPAPYWARYNYTGLEGKPAYPEYYKFMQTMKSIGEQRGCGRTMWEYSDSVLQRYGTPMAPMLMPMWTNGCIGSMEGLYFESAATTPFHFINQSELSDKCSCAQRNLPYTGLDMNLGVQHLQMLGVRYYAAASTKAIAQANANPDLTPIGTSNPWHIYEVADSALVQPLASEPAVVTDHNSGQEWVYGTSNPHPSKAKESPTSPEVKANGPAVTWYLNPTKWNVDLAADGPSSWARVADGQSPPVRPVPLAHATNVTAGTNTIDFDVDRTGTPVLVKASYFPNWEVDGAQGPYRVAPNLMVVVPTSNHVHLHYGRTSVEYTAYGLTLLGFVLLVVLARRPPLVMPEPVRDDDRLQRLLVGDDDFDDDDFDDDDDDDFDDDGFDDDDFDDAALDDE